MSCADFLPCRVQYSNTDPLAGLTPTNCESQIRQKIQTETDLLSSVTETVLKMGGAGDSPAPVGDPPNGTTVAIGTKAALLLAADALSIPSGESPDGTGW